MSAQILSNYWLHGVRQRFSRRVIMSPPVRVGRHIVFPVRPSDCPSQNLVNTTPRKFYPNLFKLQVFL